MLILKERWKSAPSHPWRPAGTAEVEHEPVKFATLEKN
jgi:hypothetical protein